MDKKCGVYKVANFAGKRWTLLILLELYKGKGKRRYSEIKSRLTGITPKILSARLKELEKDGLLEKKVDASSFPVKSEYTLTSEGKDFIGVFREMKRWAVKWKKTGELCKTADCRECGL
jgi:DNA-binding HxlR family transcriptional regulator